MLLALGLLLFAPPRGAQEDGDAIRDHLKVVRDARRGLEERCQAMDALLGLGTEGPRRLAGQLATDAQASRRQVEKEEKKLRAAFAKRATKTVAGRLDRTANREVDELRATLRRGSRDPGLTKERIIAELDPAVERLEALLTISPAAVLAADDELAAANDALRARLREEEVLLDYWQRAKTRLEATPEGEKIARRLTAPDAVAAAAESLDRDLAFLALLALPMRDADRRVFEENRALGAELEPSEVEGTEILNRRRVLVGLAALRLDPRLGDAGRGHSRDMVEKEFFSHTSPVPGKETFTQRAALAGTSASAENIAMGQRSAQGVIDAWWYSPGHHRNMMAGHARVGLGRHESYWTQMFGG